MNTDKSLQFDKKEKFAILTDLMLDFTIIIQTEFSRKQDATLPPEQLYHTH